MFFWKKKLIKNEILNDKFNHINIKKIAIDFYYKQKIRIWKKMTIILCITIIANTFHNKTIFEFNDDQFLYLLFFFSLQFVFILY